MNWKPWSADEIAQKVAHDIPDGSFVNLGIGRPESVANFIPDDKELVFHTENGLLGMGPAPAPDAVDLELINAGKKPVTLVPGAAFFHQSDSFAMIRGGHIDVCVMGALQVSAKGDLANWSTGAKGAIPAVGGAMDLSVGAKAIYVLMTHTTKDGEAKLVADITYPATSRRVVSRVYTELAVIDIDETGFVLRDIAPGLDFAELQARTGAPIRRP
jgi:3-oxoadipate CoA-transferase beta subunit